MRYVFNENTEPVKKRKKADCTKADSVLDYSAIKLPAQAFATYLDEYSSQFVADCNRWDKYFFASDILVDNR